MLNFTIKPGECFMIGEEITVVILGGTANNIKVMVDAPRSYNIVRGKVLEKVSIQKKEQNQKVYYPEPAISAESMQRMMAAQKKAKNKQGNRTGNNAVLT